MPLTSIVTNISLCSSHFMSKKLGVKKFGIIFLGVTILSVGSFFIWKYLFHNIQHIGLEQEVTLYKTDIAVVDMENLQIRVLQFDYGLCPGGMQCIWNGGVMYEVVYQNKISKQIGPRIKIGNLMIKELDTDRNSYSKIIITKDKN